jgi:hypothetical protein
VLENYKKKNVCFYYTQKKRQQQEDVEILYKVGALLH